MTTEEPKASKSGRWQFSLRTLLIVVLLVAVWSAWYGYRLRRVEIEQHLIEGKWRIVGLKGEVAILNSEPFVVEYKPGNYSVDPFQEPRWLDSHTPRGTRHGIYEWVGDRLHYMWIDPGMQRPTSFDQTDFQVEPGFNVTGFGYGTYYLERIPEK